MNETQALKWIDSELLSLRNAPKINGCEMTGDWKTAIEALEVARDAMLKMQKNKSQKPLTMLELCKMNGKAVWCYEYGSNSGEWHLVNCNGQCVTDKEGDVFYFFEYESVWIAYYNELEVNE